MPFITIVYLVTITLSVGIAIFLARLAKSASAVITKTDKTPGRYPVLSSGIDPALRQVISDKVSNIIETSGTSHQAAAKVISEIFDEELSKKAASAAHELSEKYTKIIEQKSQNEELAWEKYEKVLSEKKEADAVIRSVAEGLIVLDAQGKVVMMNPAAEKILDTSRREKIGKSLLDNLKEEQFVSLATPKSGTDGREIELVSSGEETKKTIRASSAVIENENGKTIGMVSVLSDITKQKELDRLKANFVASVSHELRTPLVAIDKAIALILDEGAGAVSPAQKQFLTIAERNIKRLSTLINDLLDLSKLEAGKMDIKRRPSSIDKIIDEVVISFHSWAQAKALNIKKESEASSIPEINIDPDRIIQVLNNLIGNAMKFTPANGQISIEAKIGNQEVAVSVADTGIGIAPENLAKVFNKFYQVGERVSTDMNGTGIGLSISKQIIELHGGKIWVESEKGSGTKFIFTLPLIVV